MTLRALVQVGRTAAMRKRRTAVTVQHSLALTLGAAVLLSLSTLVAPVAAASEGGHGSEHAEGHSQELNWIYGFVGESAEIEHPTVLYRTPGMPVPLLAYLFNTALLFGLFYRFGRKPVVDGLARRRENLMRGMDEAAKMRADAAEQLAFYEAKLQKVDAEVTRIRTEMREAAEAERATVLAEARKRRERMEREAMHMIAQELKSAKEELFGETVRGAVESARKILVESASDADHERLCEEYLSTIKTQLPGVPGGRA